MPHNTVSKTRLDSRVYKVVIFYSSFTDMIDFWATVCKTVSPMLSGRATLVYCGQTVRRIKMKLGVQVGLGPGHIVLDGDARPLTPKGHSPQFSAHICCGPMAAWSKMPLGMEVDLGPGDSVLDGDTAPPPPIFGP